MKFWKKYGARLAGFVKIVASLVAIGEFLRVKLVYALSRLVLQLIWEPFSETWIFCRELPGSSRECWKTGLQVVSRALVEITHDHFVYF